MHDAEALALVQQHARPRRSPDDPYIVAHSRVPDASREALRAWADKRGLLRLIYSDYQGLRPGRRSKAARPPAGWEVVVPASYITR